MIVNALDEFYCLIELLLLDVRCSRENDGACVLDLVLVELGEVLEVNLALACVDNSYCSADLSVFNLLDSCNYIGELADTRRLDDDAVGVESADDVLKCRSEVAYERAADASGVHLRDLDSGLLQESAVDADLSELILDENDLLIVVSVSYEFLDESCLSGSQKT